MSITLDMYDMKIYFIMNLMKFVRHKKLSYIFGINLVKYKAGLT
jgi:hypothetical protein